MIQRMLSILAACALTLAVAPSCSTIEAITSASTTTVTAEQLASARDVAYGLEGGYGLTLTVAIAWGKPANRCGLRTAPPPPLCSTLANMERSELVRVKVRSAINRLNEVIADTNTTTSVLSAALSVAKAAYAEYQSAVPAVK